MAKQQRFIVHGITEFQHLGGPDHGKVCEMGFTVPAEGIEELIDRLTVIKEDGNALELIEIL